jgi:hypothetical protein
VHEDAYSPLSSEREHAAALTELSEFLLHRKNPPGGKINPYLFATGIAEGCPVHILIIIALLLALVFLLGFGLMSVFQQLTERCSQGEPVFLDPGPIFPDQGASQQQARSQFAWQSRSHSRDQD